MIHGHEVSNITTEVKLRHYFRLLEAAEHSERGGWIINHTRDGREPDDIDMDWIYGGTPRALGYPETLGTFKIHGYDSTNGNREDWLDLYPEASNAALDSVGKAAWEDKLRETSGIDVTRMFLTRSTFLEISESAIFLETKIHHRKLAIILWNRRSKRGLARLLKEILVYRWIAANRSDMLGQVVPCVMGLRDDPPQECVLVTEIIGKDLYWFRPAALDCVYGRNKENERRGMYWYVNGVQLTERDKREIEESATRNLRRLKKIGIIHRNPSPAHLRAERIKEWIGLPYWRTWWVGLGHVTLLDEKKFGDLKYINSLHKEYEAAAYLRNYEPVFKLGPP